jgi:hypothetical protein
MFGRSRAISYSNHGVERETRLELATLTLARYRSNSVFAKGRRGHLNDYLLPISTGIHADQTGRHTNHTAFHADHKTLDFAETTVAPALQAIRVAVRGQTRLISAPFRASGPLARGDPVGGAHLAALDRLNLTGRGGR